MDKDVWKHGLPVLPSILPPLPGYNIPQSILNHHIYSQSSYFSHDFNSVQFYKSFGVTRPPPHPHSSPIFILFSFLTTDMNTSKLYPFLL